MAQILFVYMSERTREYLTILLYFFNLLSTLISVIILLMSVSDIFYFKEKAELLGANISFATFGWINISWSLFATILQLSLCYLLYYSRRSLRRKTAYEYGFFTIFVVCYLLSALIVIPGIFIYSKFFLTQIDESFHTGMEAKLKSYLTNVQEQIALNKLQFEYKCCGAKNYKDWDFLGKHLSDKPSVPFSCCKSRIIGPCYNTKLSNKLEKYDGSLNLETINTKGCAKVFYYSISIRTYNEMGLWLLILLMHLFTALSFQYWQSSVHRAIQKKGNPKSRSEGYLWVPFFGTVKEVVKENLKDITQRLKESNPLLGQFTFGKSISSRRTKGGPPQHTKFERMPNDPARSPRYDLFAQEIMTKRNQTCTVCDRSIYPNGNHLCNSPKDSTAISLMAVTKDLTDSDNTESNEEEYQKNYKNNQQVQKLLEKSGGNPKNVKLEPTKGQPFTTTDEDYHKTDALKRKFRERYFILKEIR